MEFKSVSGEYNVGAKSLKSAIKLKCADSFTAKLKLTSPGAPSTRYGIELDGKGWEASYDAKTKDLAFERKFKLSKGDLKIKQKLPGSRFELLPSPEVQWKSHIVKGKKVAWEVEPSYCFQQRKAKLEQTLELSGKHKLKLESDSKAGVRATIATLSTKPSGSWAKQLSLKYSGSAGASLIHEIEPGKKVSLKSTMGIRSKDLKLVAEVKPGKVAGVKPKLTLEGKVSAKAPLCPSGLIAGLSLDC